MAFVSAAIVFCVHLVAFREGSSDEGDGLPFRRFDGSAGCGDGDEEACFAEGGEGDGDRCVRGGVTAEDGASCFVGVASPALPAIACSMK